MGALAWVIVIGEILLAVFVMRLVWQVESDRPTETIVPETDDDTELVG